MPLQKTTGKKVTFSATPPSAQLDQWVNATPTESALPLPTPQPTVPTKPIETVKMKRLTLDISEELHRSIKLKAVTQGVSMVDLLRDLLEQTYGKP